MKDSTTTALTLGAIAMANAMSAEYRLDTFRAIGGAPNFRGMKIGGVNKHFNKKRHGKMLRRKHAKA